MPRTRCPNGSRKNKHGDCVKTTHADTSRATKKIKDLESTQTQTQTQKLSLKRRCPKGTRKNKEGKCISTKTELVNKQSVDMATPRTKYAKTYFSNKPIIMSDNHGPGEAKVLFQVGFTTPKQFENYANLSERPKIDCFYQSLFSIGLIDVNKAKKNSEDVNTKGKIGVSTSAIKEYLEKSFELSSKEKIQYETLNIPGDAKGFLNIKVQNETITQFFMDHLKNNHATIFTIQFFIMKDGKRADFSHAIVAYKYNYRIYFFDPQNKGLVNNKSVKSRTLMHLIKYYGNRHIVKMGYFNVYGLDGQKKLVNSECPIPYEG